MANSNIVIKQEILDDNSGFTKKPPEKSSPAPQSVFIDLSSSDDSDSDSDSDSGSDSGSFSGNGSNRPKKKRKSVQDVNFALPLGFLDPLPPPKEPPLQLPAPPNGSNRDLSVSGSNCKQFWKAGDYEGSPSASSGLKSGGIDHVRVHPKFLHSNATSHKWVLGALAELLDNSLDEVSNGATYVNIDMVKNKKDGSRMLLIEDNGGGMDPERMRHCMSLGYSVKSKMADTIGQYGNGFKTSTMRLGADVIVFSRSGGKPGKSPTQSIGLLSYTFLRNKGMEDIIVPMLDYEKREGWDKIIRSSPGDWDKNLETIVEWSPFSSEVDLLRQFNPMKGQGTRIIVYNLWEDDQGLLELDFDADPHDIQIRGVNRDERSIQMAKQYPNSRHFLTYRHSLRSYTSILYLRVAPGFRIILRGKDVEHHNIVNDMMMTQEVTYRPMPGADGVPKDSNMVATVKIGFVKDAKSHIDVQGFNVYHKNRLIKPFWRLWHAPGSDGRGVIGVLEANFVEPAHDKQGFERTTVLSRLEARLVQMQKTYWSTLCHKIGYAPRRNRKAIARENSPDYLPSASQSKHNSSGKSSEKSNGVGHLNGKHDGKTKRSRNIPSSLEPSTSAEDDSDDSVQVVLPKNQPGGHQKHTNGKDGYQPGGHQKHTNGKDGSRVMHSPPGFGQRVAEQVCSPGGSLKRVTRSSRSKVDADENEGMLPDNLTESLEQLKAENRELKERLRRKEEEILGDLLRDLQLERERSKSLEAQLQESTRKIEELNKEQESLIDIFTEERQRRDMEEENLRKKLKDASNTIQELLDKVQVLEKTRSVNHR
ncbi:protein MICRORCHIDIA 7-like isoform X1 [Solanum stenotomum]|uniref:protein MICRORCHIDIA 7-like isoform X1 n=1 Tax=Solanum stenotomum TaxID=172797 RepID=UPI0020D12D93|nr:protein MICRORCHIDIA 7-like isoform X1 [Solanum stenotomum]